MPLGDSITKGDGCEGTSSYRKFLADSLEAHHLDFDFVGSITCTEDLGYDTDNQGLAGWTTGNILNGYPDAPEKGNLQDWAPRYRPNIVLIHLGTNDIAQNFTAGQVLANLSGIVAVLRNANPEVRIYAAEILPMLDQWGMKARAIALNDSLVGWALKQRVTLVDQYTGIVPADDLYDGTHPNRTGYGKMAVRWFAALRGEFVPVPLRASPGPIPALGETGWTLDGRQARGIVRMPLVRRPSDPGKNP